MDKDTIYGMTTFPYHGVSGTVQSAEIQKPNQKPNQAKPCSSLICSLNVAHSPKCKSTNRARQPEPFQPCHHNFCAYSFHHLKRSHKAHLWHKGSASQSHQPCHCKLVNANRCVIQGESKEGKAGKARQSRKQHWQARQSSRSTGDARQSNRCCR